LTKLQQEIQQKEVSSINEKIRQKPYKFLKLENIKITSKQATKRANHYRVNYLDKYQNTGFFFLDSHFRDKKEVIQPDLVGDFLLVRVININFFMGLVKITIKCIYIKI